jgi:oxygen-independent coproporphyrinogen-3 oxidase
MDMYVARLCEEIRGARGRVDTLGAILPERVDTIYFGGGTPSLLAPEMMKSIFTALREQFTVEAGAEITLECAPGQLTGGTLTELLEQGLSRVSLGVQSFVDVEATAVGRLHTRAICLAEIARLRSAGLLDINVDLIAGLPLQTEASWRYSLAQALGTEAPHVSIYMLEVDGESRLGRESLAGGSRYGAGTLPSDEAVADWYLEACARLGSAGVAQYEISNFAPEGFRSRHNLKYWRRKAYLGVGLDAHSMLLADDGAVRFQNSEDLGAYLGDQMLPLLAPHAQAVRVFGDEAFEEAMFLGLRLNEGVELETLRLEFGSGRVLSVLPALTELQEAGLVQMSDDRIWLTDQGRLLSNEVFERVLVEA